VLINVDPLNEANVTAPGDLASLGFGGVRLVCRSGVESYIEECHATDLFVLGIITPESQGNMLGGICDCYQIGNEPDLPGALSPAAYIDEARIYRNTYPDLYMISAGLASGQTGYWRNIAREILEMGYQGFAVHPYGKTARQAEYMLKSYVSLSPNLPLWITEWNRPAREILDWKAMLTRVGVVESCWFSWGYDQWALTKSQLRALRA